VAYLKEQKDIKNNLNLKSMEQSIRKIRTAKSLAMAKKAIRAHCKSLPI